MDETEISEETGDDTEPVDTEEFEQVAEVASSTPVEGAPASPDPAPVVTVSPGIPVDVELDGKGNGAAIVGQDSTSIRKILANDVRSATFESLRRGSSRIIITGGPKSKTITVGVITDA